MDKKTCTKCRREQPISEFRNRSHPRTHLKASWCKTCYRKRRMRNKLRDTYGLSWEEYKELYRNQGGKCRICGTKGYRRQKGYRLLDIDHNHTTGKVRGLLCSQCNVAIGMMKEDPILLRRAAKYLEVC